MGEDNKHSIDILVVDDERDVANMIALNLELDGYEVRIAYNGREALDEVERRIPDCILLDIMMPVINGWEVLQELKADERTADIPVIMVTARHTDVDRIKGFSGGAVAYVTKPFDPETLKGSVEKALQPRNEEAEEEIRRDRIRRLQLSALYEITEALTSTLEIDEVLEIIADKLQTLFDLDVCAISLADSSGDALRLASVRSTAPLSRKDLALFDFSPLRLGEALGVDLNGLSYPKPVSISVLSGREAKGLPRGLKSSYVLPLRVKERFTGVIFMGGEKHTRLSAEEEELLSAIGNQAAIAIDNARLYDDLRYDEEVRKQLLQKVISAQEDERRRVAMELHDGVVQNMVSALYRLQLCSARMGDPPAEARKALQESQLIVSEGIDEIRRIIAGLRPAMLDDLGLAVALEKYVRLIEEGAPFTLRIEIDDAELPPLSLEVETALFRIAQEALNNVKKHSHCEESSLSLRVNGGCLVLEVTDDGIGFELPGIRHRPAHNFGLVGMQERVESLRGSLEIETASGRGTSIVARFPLEEVVREV